MSCPARCPLCEDYVFIGVAKDGRLLGHLLEKHGGECYCGVAISSARDKKKVVYRPNSKTQGMLLRSYIKYNIFYLCSERGNAKRTTSSQQKINARSVEKVWNTGIQETRLKVIN